MSLKALHEKVADFDSKLGEKSRALSQCRKGCSQCCHVDLSVFRIESDAIRDWFIALSAKRKEELRSLWSSPVGEKHCPFLYQDACTIYEARPLICRTQGLPLRFHEGGQTYLDICPLNEDMLDVALASEVMNLDLLNLILSQMEKQAGADRPRERLFDLKNELMRKESFYR